VAGKNDKSQGVSGYQLNGQEGWASVRGFEDNNAIASEQTFNTHILHYDIVPNNKGWEVTAVVQTGEYETARKAEWAGFMAVKKRHASVYAESKMAMKVEGGYHVFVRWMIWDNTKPRENYNNPSK